MAHAGREPEALEAARRLIEVFERAGVDVIAVNAAGCGSNIKEYAHLLRDDPEFAARAQAFAAKCRDITELIAELGFECPANPVPLKVAYHDACHLQHAQGIRAQPRQLLSAIPGLEWTELPEAATCCGSAGIFNLIEPETARQLADRKAQHVTPLRSAGAGLRQSRMPSAYRQRTSARGPSSAGAAHRRTHRRRARAARQ